ncbi:MAG: translation elongation factor Ts, partial [Myxococcota bacterium]
RVATEGEVRCSVTADHRSAAMVEVNIETDFSARNDKFKDFVSRALSGVEGAPADVAFTDIEVDGEKLGETAENITGVIGEKITLRRYAKLSLAEGKSGLCYAYVHMGGKIGVILSVEASSADAASHAATQTLAEETALQIAAMNPTALTRDEISETEVAKQKEIFEAQLREDPKPKPEKVWPKIIEGKLNNWYSEAVLLEQLSAQHGKKKIADLVAEAGKAAGGDLTITAFVRYQLGEGIEKQEEDFRAGVAELLQQ